MCGIAGFTGVKNSALSVAMSASLSHRGPDGEGFYNSNVDHINLIHRRLAITDINGGNQPMWNEDKSICIIFNGEIYNHIELKKELLSYGHKFSSDHSDTEVIIHGYEQWGEEILKRLNGMFAFCIYDTKQKGLFLARDRFGEKPLYYYSKKDLFIFASEIDALLLHPNIKKEIDNQSLSKYFAYGFIPAPNTIYKDIHKLPAGNFIKFNLKNLKKIIGEYWSYSINPDSSLDKLDEKEAASELKYLLKKSISKRKSADVPLGLFLSGGLDSSSILALLREIEPNQNINTFSLGFTEDSFNEAGKAQLIAKKFQTDHHELKIDSNFLKNNYMGIIDHIDDPIGDSSIIPLYYLAKFARKHVKVALGGDGSDELFCGYAPFKALKYANIYKQLVPDKINSFLYGLSENFSSSEKYFSLGYKIHKGLSAMNYKSEFWNPVWLSPLDVNDLSELFGQKIYIEDIYKESTDAWTKSTSDNIYNKTSEFYVKFYLQDNIMTKIDRASMLNGLEIRSPFLDNEVVEFARKIPAHLKFKNGQSKFILKKAMLNILPKNIIDQKKQGFALPMAKWLKDWDYPAKTYKQFDPAFIKNKITEHARGKNDSRLFLWNWIAIDRYIKSHNKI